MFHRCKNLITQNDSTSHNQILLDSSYQYVTVIADEERFSPPSALNLTQDGLGMISYQKIFQLFLYLGNIANIF